MITIPTTWTLNSYESAYHLNVDIPGTVVRNTYTLNDILPLDAQSNNLIKLSNFQSQFQFNGINGAGVSIVVIDSGADLDHVAFGPDLNIDGRADRIAYSYDFSGSNDSDASDFSGHGTHVAGIAAGSFNTIGVASGANLIILKVFPDSGGSASQEDIIEALQWVSANAAAYNIAAVNLSLGNGSNQNSVTTSGYATALNAIKAQGVAVVAASGNSYGSFQVPGVSVPAADAAAWAIGAVYDASYGGISFGGNATDFSSAPDQIAAFSQRSPTLTDLFAPGAFVLSSDLNNSFSERAGTSMSAPFVTGLVALMQDLSLEQTGERLSVDTMLKLLRDNAVTIFDGASSSTPNDPTENDNVVNTNAAYKRIDVLNTMNAILEHFRTGKGFTLDTSGNYQDGTVFAGWRGADFLTGRATNDRIIGNIGNDTIDGGLGADNLFGGLGNDIFYVDNTGDVVTEAMGEGFDYVYTSVSFTQWTHVEYVLATGAASLTGSGNSDINAMDATLRFNGVTFNTLGGNDVLYGSNYADSLNGGADNDIIFGYASVNGADTLIGGTGNDVYYVYEADDVLIEIFNEGLDTVFAYANVTLSANIEQVELVGAGTSATGNAQNNNIFGNNSASALTLAGQGGNDWMIGGTGNDTLIGGAGNDQLQGGAGTNTMQGGLNDDQYYSTSPDDIISENLSEGFDTLYTSYNVVALAANVEQISVSGGVTTANGNSLANVLYANNNNVGTNINADAGADIVYGSGFADTIVGGLGNDTMQGAGGADRFTYSVGNMGADLITDFADGSDLLVLTGLGYTSGLIGGAISIGGGANALVTFVSGNLGGTSVTLLGVNQTNITAADFVF
jgi:subtilisin family serine protease